MLLPFSTTNTIAITLLGVIIPFFIFAVTLLGSAIEKAKREESKIKEDARKDFDIKINDMENKIKSAKQTGDSSELEKQLEELIINKKNLNKQLKKIQQKYSILRFKESIIYPGSCFILAVLLNEVAKIHEDHIVVRLLLWLLSILGITMGVYRLCQCLILVQEVSITSEEFQIEKSAHAFKTALILHEKEKKEELYIYFRDIKFPYTCSRDTEIEIKFMVGLKKGKIAKKVEVWFFVPDGFGLISPPEQKSWRQSEFFVVPNIRTVKIELGDVNTGANSRGSLKVKSPNVTGEYFLMYGLNAEGYSSDTERIKIIVQ